MKSKHSFPWHHVCTLAVLSLASVAAQALSFSVPKLLIDSAVSKKFPQEKYGLLINNPVLQFHKPRQKIALCGQWSSKLVKKNGDFCIDFQPQWNKQTGEIEIANVNLLTLTASEGHSLPESVTRALNGSLLQLLDGTAIYKVPETIGKHLEGIEVLDNSIQMNF